MFERVKEAISDCKNAIQNAYNKVQATRKVLTARAISSLGTRGSSMINKIIGIAVGMLVVALIFPIAIDELVSVDTTDWPSALEPIFTTLLPVLAVLGVVLYLVGDHINF